MHLSGFNEYRSIYEELLNVLWNKKNANGNLRFRDGRITETTVKIVIENI